MNGVIHNLWMKKAIRSSRRSGALLRKSDFSGVVVLRRPLFKRFQQGVTKIFENSIDRQAGAARTAAPRRQQVGPNSFESEAGFSARKSRPGGSGTRVDGTAERGGVRGRKGHKGGRRRKKASHPAPTKNSEGHPRDTSKERSRVRPGEEGSGSGSQGSGRKP